MIVYLDTEFTSLEQRILLSLGMVTDDGRELYLEVDLESEDGKRLRPLCSDMVVKEVLPMWGLIPGAACTLQEMGDRAAQWMRAQGRRMPGQKLTLSSDSDTDGELVMNLLRESGNWHDGPIREGVRDLVRVENIYWMTGTPEGEIAAQACWEDLKASRGLKRHHALADAMALRQAARPRGQ